MKRHERDAIRVRRLAATEWRQLREIRLRSLADAPLAFGSTLERESARTDADWQRQAAEADEGQGAVAVIAEVEWRPVALARGFVGTSDDAERRRVAWLVGVFVEPEWRGMGVAARVVSEVIAWARERRLAELFLHVGDWNVPARRTYESLGFVATGVQVPLARDRSVTESEMRLVL
jgi:GNAT superfamily N-acetyltransferase